MAPPFAVPVAEVAWLPMKVLLMMPPILPSESFEPSVPVL